MSTGIPPVTEEREDGEEKGRQEVLTALPRTKRAGRIEQEAGALAPFSA